tara:strand:+ start:230 stop:514 length:285 start_codon:yes stop_codon:yes gene_type:complete
MIKYKCTRDSESLIQPRRAGGESQARGYLLLIYLKISLTASSRYKKGNKPNSVKDNSLICLRCGVITTGNFLVDVGATLVVVFLVVRFLVVVIS